MASDPISLPYLYAPAATIAMAPVAPQIIPGRPPNAAVINPTKTADQRPTMGLTPAMNEKAMASGTRRSDTVIPDRVSSL